jgi:hypothetical protein
MKKQAKKTIKKTSKKTTSKKTTSAKKTKLITELTKIAKTLPEEGIDVLIKQAEVIMHNLQVEEEFYANQKKREKKIKERLSKRDLIEIQEADDNSYFSITINGENKMFLLDEMRNLVKICHSTNDEKEAARKMYRWFELKRMDVLNDVYIDTPYHYLLIALYNFLKNRYTAK